MARFWLGPWEWNTDLESAGWWSAPAGSLGCLDLRSLPQCGTAIIPLGFGLFVTPNATALGSAYTNLGTDPERLLTEPQKRVLESALLLPRTLAANRLMGIVYESLTLQSDPTGDLRCLPLMPTMRRRFEVWLAGQKVSDREWSFAAPEFDVARDTLKRIYRQLREGSLEGKLPPELYRKWLGFQVRKYRLTDNQYRAMQPSDLPDETPLQPTTTITDNFDRANNTDLSVGAPFAWTEVVGDVQIAGNDVETIGVNATRTRGEVDLSGSDHYAQGNLSGTVINQLRTTGPACRFASAADTCYAVTLGGPGAVTGTLQIRKYIAGVLTNLGAGTTQTHALPDLIKLACSGSTLESFFKGTLAESITDTSITGGLRTGFVFELGTGNVNIQFDDFEAADLAAPPAGGGFIIGGGFFGPGLAA